MCTWKRVIHPSTFVWGILPNFVRKSRRAKGFRRNLSLHMVVCVQDDIYLSRLQLLKNDFEGELARDRCPRLRQALQQPIIKQQQQMQIQQQQLMRQDEAAGSVAVLLPENQQPQQQQQKLVMMPTFTGSFVHAGVNPAPPSAVPSSGGLPGKQTIAGGQSRWTAGAAGLVAGTAAVPPTPGVAVGAATPMPFQQHQPPGFVAAASGPTPMFPALGIAGAGGVGMLGAVMGGRLGLIGSNISGSNWGGFQQQQQQPPTIVASSIRGTNRAAEAGFDLQQQQQQPPSVLPQNAHQPLQQQDAVGFSGRPGQTVTGSAFPTFASAFSPAPALAPAPKPTGAPGADSGLMSDGATMVAAAPGAGTTAVAVVTAASGPFPRPWNGGVVDDDDWGPEGEEEFMNMLNLAMDDEVKQRVHCCFVWVQLRDLHVQ